MPDYGHYELKATDTGFELVWVGNTMRVRIVETSGHGPIEEIYAAADQLHHKGAPRLVERKTPAPFKTE